MSRVKKGKSEKLNAAENRVHPHGTAGHAIAAATHEAVGAKSLHIPKGLRKGKRASQ
jgi:hypothetical protein